MKISSKKRVDEVHQHTHRMAQNFIETAYACFHSGNLETCAPFAAHFRDLRSNTYIQPNMVDIMTESLDYEKGPELKDLFMLLLKTAKGGDRQAIALLERMAFTYANFNTCAVTASA